MFKNKENSLDYRTYDKRNNTEAFNYELCFAIVDDFIFSYEKAIAPVSVKLLKCCMYEEYCNLHRVVTHV